MAFGMGMMAKMPEHTSWAGALWDGTAQAAKSVASLGKMAIMGEADFKDPSGKTHTVPVDRGFALKSMGTAITGAYSAHTMSLREPEKFKQWNDAVTKFQAAQPQRQN